MGWNSTKFFDLAQRGMRFQFPMGWNSTKNGSKWQTMPERFNSQWDGILPLLCSAPFVPLSCFNSQQDGILPSFHRGSFCPRRFQFPTGWNSTLFLGRSRGYIVVSISNGMKFYIDLPPSNISLKLCFNSQRDGILSGSRGFTQCAYRFQFPTGWNSTRRRIRKAFSNACFNSQRDGILRWMSYLIR